jgi:hypothetical protein
MKHAPRVFAEHPSGASRHGGNATVPRCANGQPSSYGALRLVSGSYGQICDSPLLHLSIQVDPISYPKNSVPLHLRLPADSAAGDATATSRDSLLDDMAAFPSPTPSEIAKAAPESPSVEPGAPAIAQEAASRKSRTTAEPSTTTAPPAAAAPAAAAQVGAAIQQADGPEDAPPT